MHFIATSLLILSLLETSAAGLCRAPPRRLRSFDLKDFGGRPEAEDNLQAFQRAIEAIKEAGGGELVLSEGVYITSPFNVTSNFTLRIADGATLKGIANISKHPVLQPLPTYGQGN